MLGYQHFPIYVIIQTQNKFSHMMINWVRDETRRGTSRL